MTMAEAAFETLMADEDIADDLRTLGATTVVDLDQTRRDTLASWLMKEMAQNHAATAQLEASRDSEIQFIAARYAPSLDRLRTRLGELDRAVQAIAAHTKDAQGYVGKKKSRDVGAGTYGFKSYAAGAELKDEPAFIAWAEEHAPSTLRVKPTMSLKQAREYLTTDELAGVKREIMKNDVTKLIATDPNTLPPGYEKTPAVDEYYAKPLPLAAIAPSSVETKAA
ncbi:MAG TPA: host-nuclease inhibitor Gam family protein [Gemmatimonadaceae bacterium]|jgi:phage host-nuclease inhibitor protein Gam